MVERFCPLWIKYAVMVVLVIYMYGAMCLKYASGAVSFATVLIEFAPKFPFDPYYLGLIIFGVLSLFFCFGNIENSKGLQLFTGAFRLVVIILLYGTTIFSLGKYGLNVAPVFNFGEQLSHIANVFGGTVFVFVFHHSISGIVFPIRPQSQIKPMFLASHLVGGTLLALEGLLAYLAFSGLTNQCSPTEFPCRIEDLFNLNFSAIPVIGVICNLYPMLNVSSVPVLTITLRNNLMQVVPIKEWLSKSESKAAKFML
jgi:hypothetical protein